MTVAELAAACAIARANGKETITLTVPKKPRGNTMRLAPGIVGEVLSVSDQGTNVSVSLAALEVVIADAAVALSVSVGPTARCKHCEGTGRRPPTPAELRTLEVLSDRWADTAEVTRRLGITRTATCNRLAYALEAGLVERRARPGDGSRGGFEWRIAQQDKTK